MIKDIRLLIVDKFNLVLHAKDYHVELQTKVDQFLGFFESQIKGLEDLSLMKERKDEQNVHD